MLAYKVSPWSLHQCARLGDFVSCRRLFSRSRGSLRKPPLHSLPLSAQCFRSFFAVCCLVKPEIQVFRHWPRSYRVPIAAHPGVSIAANLYLSLREPPFLDHCGESFCWREQSQAQRFWAWSVFSHGFSWKVVTWGVGFRHSACAAAATRHHLGPPLLAVSPAWSATVIHRSQGWKHGTLCGSTRK